ncbi:glycosyltransferase [bacterium]|nr:glycosyltransferase [bacterium]
MRILFLTDRLPYPFSGGISVRTFNLMQSLAREHELHLLSLVSDTGIQAGPVTVSDELRRLCSSVIQVPHRPQAVPSRSGHYLKNVLQKEPWMITEYHQLPFREKLQEVLASRQFDLVQAELLSMTQYLPFDRRIRTVYGAQNIESALLWQRMKHFYSPVVKYRCFKEYLRVRHYERMIMRKVQLTIAVTREDQIKMHHLAPYARISYFPITIDTDQWQPSTDEYDRPTIIFVGTLSWHPNVDGLLWFTRDIFPLIRSMIPETQLIIVGRDPVPEVTRLQEIKAIQLQTSVPEIAPFLKKNALFIVPLRLGGGMRVKILEALSRGMPIVTTGVGCEGLEVQNRQQLLIENKAEAFAQACAHLLSNRMEQNRLSQAGRMLAVQNYHWHNLNGRLSALYNLIEEL